jgi:hypothetical protein
MRSVILEIYAFCDFRNLYILWFFKFKRLTLPRLTFSFSGEIMDKMSLVYCTSSVTKKWIFFTFHSLKQSIKRHESFHHGYPVPDGGHSLTILNMQNTSIYLHFLLFRTVYYYQVAIWYIRPYFKRHVTLIVNTTSQYKRTPRHTVDSFVTSYRLCQRFF